MDTIFKKFIMKMIATPALSTKGFENVPITQSRCDFEFIVGDKTYPCPALIADFLSPRLARIHAADDTISSFSVETRDEGEFFGEFLSLGLGKPLMLTPSNQAFHFGLAKELQNLELFEFLMARLENQISIENTVLILKSVEEMGIESSSELRFIVSHFDEISTSDINELSFEDLRRILGCSQLKISSEESLYDLISQRNSKDPRYFGLFEMIRFEFLPPEYFSEYFELVSNSFEYFTISHWTSLQFQFLLPVESHGKNDCIGPTLSIEYRASSPLLGIIAHLTKACGGDVHDRGVVHVTASSIYAHSSCPNCSLTGATEMTDSNCFGSHNQPNSWLCSDFKDSLVRPNHYSIRSCAHSGWSGYQLLSWVIETSNDDKEWIEIDRHENDCSALSATGSFSITKPCKFSRYIRLRQIGKISNGKDDNLLVTSFKVFGHIQKSK
jgi:hypothetical protein